MTSIIRKFNTNNHIMGSMLQPVCDCNHTFRLITAGGGMMNFMEKCVVPFYCDHCCTISHCNVMKEKHRCGKCDKKLTMYGKLLGYMSPDNPDYNYNPEKVVFDWTVGPDLQYILENKKYHCPSCKKETLEFLSFGHWD